MALSGSNRATASLSATLLARKGTARPAMRPQGYGGFGAPGSADDLGWNDIAGEAGGDADPGSTAASTAPDQSYGGDPSAMPSVLRLRQALHAELELAPSDPAFDAVDRAQLADEAQPAAVAAPTPDTLATGARAANGEPPDPAAADPLMIVGPAACAGELPVGAAADVRSRRAFTLRLDAERHLRLRLATAILGISAQKLVTAALDALLHTLPDVDDVARSLPRADAVARDPEGDVR